MFYVHHSSAAYYYSVYISLTCLFLKFGQNQEHFLSILDVLLIFALQY